MDDKMKKYFFSFVELTDEEWEEQQKHFITRRIPKNDFLIKEGMICREISYVRSGLFRTYNLVKDKELTTNFFFQGSYTTDYVSMITEKPSKEYIQAVEDSEIVSLPYERIKTLYDKYENYQKFGRLIAEKLFISMYERQQDLLLLTPKERYLKLMEQRPKVMMNVAQIYIASYLGITPEYLSRLRRTLRDEQATMKS